MRLLAALLLVAVMSPSRTADVVRLECVSADVVEVELHSDQMFPVRNALVEFDVGPITTSFSRYGDDGDLHTLVFMLTRKQFDQISEADVAYVRYNPDPPDAAWLVGSLDTGAAIGC